MPKKVLIIAGCVLVTLVVAITARSVWLAYSAKHRFETVIADYSASRTPTPAATTN
jgi:hypothetical protein